MSIDFELILWLSLDLGWGWMHKRGFMHIFIYVCIYTERGDINVYGGLEYKYKALTEYEAQAKNIFQFYIHILIELS